MTPYKRLSISTLLSGWSKTSGALKPSDVSHADNTGITVPIIQELRSLIDGCPQNEIGGGCGVIDPDCLASGCSGSCTPCDAGSGPGEDGCYWEMGIWSGACDTYWSNSPRGAPDYWGVNYETSNVFEDNEGGTRSIRCVSDM